MSPQPEPASDDPSKPYLHAELPQARRLCEEFRAAIESRPPAPAAFADRLAVVDAIRACAAANGALAEPPHDEPLPSKARTSSIPGRRP